MLLDIKRLQRTVGDIIADRIGAELSQLGGKPSIGMARIGNTKFKYPYATIDIINVLNTNSDVTNKRLDSEGNSVYETHTDVLFQISVRSDEGNSSNLARRVQRAFSFEGYLGRIYEEAEATVAKVSEITPIPDVLSDKQIEFATFNVTLRINDKEVIEDTGYITAIETTGSMIDGNGYITDVQAVSEIIKMWRNGVYQYSSYWVFSDTWGIE